MIVPNSSSAYLSAAALRVKLLADLAQSFYVALTIVNRQLLHLSSADRWEVKEALDAIKHAVSAVLSEVPNRNKIDELENVALKMIDVAGKK